MKRFLMAAFPIAVAISGPAATVLVAQTTFSQPLNYAQSTLAATRAPNSTEMLLQPGTGQFFGAPTPTNPIRVVVYRASTLQNGQVVPTTTRTVFKVTGRDGDRLTGVAVAAGEGSGNVDQTFVKDDPISAPITAGMILELQAAVSGSMDAVTYAATISLDVTKGTLHKVTATGDATVNASAGGIAGQEMTVLVVNDATPRTITFGANFRSAGTLTGTASKVATVRFASDGTSWFETGRTTGLLVLPMLGMGWGRRRRALMAMAA